MVLASGVFEEVLDSFGLEIIAILPTEHALKYLDGLSLSLDFLECLLLLLFHFLLVKPGILELLYLQVRVHNEYLIF